MRASALDIQQRKRANVCWSQRASAEQPQTLKVADMAQKRAQRKGKERGPSTSGLRKQQMHAGLNVHRSAHCRAAGNIQDGGHGKGARRKGEELGTSAIERETLRYTRTMMAGRCGHQAMACRAGRVVVWKQEAWRLEGRGAEKHDDGEGEVVIRRRLATARQGLET